MHIRCLAVSVLADWSSHKVIAALFVIAATNRIAAGRPRSPSPNFFIVGAARCGTTSLFDALSNHRDVFCCPIKEPTHFARDLVEDPAVQRLAERERQLVRVGHGGVFPPPRFAITPDRDAYTALFLGWSGQRAIGEASTSYLPSRVAAREIAAAQPGARIVMILRDPVKRAYSEFLMRQQLGQRLGSFHDTVLHEVSALGDCEVLPSGLVFSGLYARQVRRYLTHFPPSQVLVLLFEELIGQPKRTLRRVLDHLGVDPVEEAPVDLGWENQSRVARLGWLNRTLAHGGVKSLLLRATPRSVRRRLRSVFYQTRPPDPPASETTDLLREVFRTDLEATSNLIGRDLSHWLQR